MVQFLYSWFEKIKFSLVTLKYIKYGIPPVDNYDYLCAHKGYQCMSLPLTLDWSVSYMYVQITLHSADFAGDKNVAFDFLDACHFGHSIFFTIKIFLSIASDFSFQHFNVGKLDCDWMESHNTLRDRITWFFWYRLFFCCVQNNQDVSPISTYK